MIYKKNKFQLLILLAIIILAGWTGWTSWQNKKIKQSQEVIIDQNQYLLSDILSKVKQHVELPDDMPLMAVIDNASALKSDQAFYAEAQNDDILLIFTDKAIIYRPDADLVVNIGQVVFAQP